MPSSTGRRTSTRATLRRSPVTVLLSAIGCRRSGWSADAAEPTTATSPGSLPPGRLPHKKLKSCAGSIPAPPSSHHSAPPIWAAFVRRGGAGRTAPAPLHAWPQVSDPSLIAVIVMLVGWTELLALPPVSARQFSEIVPAAPCCTIV